MTTIKSRLIAGFLLAVMALPASAIVITEEFIYPGEGDGFSDPVGHLTISEAAGITAFMVGNNDVIDGWAGGSGYIDNPNPPEGFWRMVAIDREERGAWSEEYDGTLIGFVSNMTDDMWNFVFGGEYERAMVFYSEMPLGNETYDFVFVSEMLASPFVAMNQLGVYANGMTTHGPVSAVPLPAALPLFLFGLLGIVLSRSRRVLDTLRGIFARNTACLHG